MNPEPSDPAFWVRPSLLSLLLLPPPLLSPLCGCVGSNWRKNCLNGSAWSFTGMRCSVEMLTTAGWSLATRSAKDIGAPGRGARDEVPGAFCGACAPACHVASETDEFQSCR